MRVLKECVPAAVPGIAFLSGGQSDVDATARLDAMNKLGGLPWKVSFSYSRALQAAPQKAWSGKPENVAAAQAAFAHRARMNGLASLGQWKPDLEQAAPECDGPQGWWAETAFATSPVMSRGRAWETSPRLTMPTICIASSSTGSLRICFPSMMRTASSTSSLSRQ